MTSNLPPNVPYPWERRDDEPPKAWAAFTHYRDTPTQARSSGTTAQHLIDQGQVTGTFKTVRNRVNAWQSRYEWVERARLWDYELDKRRREQFVQAHIDTSRRHAVIAQAGLRFAAAPIEEFVRRLSRREGQDHDYLRNMTMGELGQLSVQCARIMPALMAAESQARGNVPVTSGSTVPSPESGEVKRPTVDRIRQVAAAMEQANAFVVQPGDGER